MYHVCMSSFIIDVQQFRSIIEDRYELIDFPYKSLCNIFHPKLCKVKGIQVFWQLLNSLSPHELEMFKLFVQGFVHKHCYTLNTLCFESIKEKYEEQLQLVLLVQYYFGV